MTTGLTIEGSGINLQPEESTNWTVGVDFTPLALQGLELSVTYFNILHEERVSTPFPSGYDFFGVLLDPAYAAVVTRTQDQAALVALIEEYSRVACYTATTIVYPCTAPPLDEVTAIVDRRIRNLAAVRQEGIDFQLHYQLRSPIGEWGFTLSGQHLLKNSERLVNTAPYSEQLNNVWRPVDLRLRSGVSFTRGVVNANAFINYIDSYRDRRDPSSVRAVQRSTVASWATVDLSAQYDLSAQLAARSFRITLAQCGQCL